MNNQQETGLAKYFEFSKHGTSYRKELIAGMTTFLAMAYILVVNPLILSTEGTGISYGSAFTATAVAAIVGSLIMGFVGKYPVALAPGMGLNAFFAFTVVLAYGIPWQTALAGVLVSGIISLILSVSGIRETVINAIPLGLKYAVSAGIGLFITFIGVTEAGIIVADPGTIITLGSLTDPHVALALFGLLITSILMVRKVSGAIFFGMIITSIVGMIFGLVPLPTQVFSAPPAMEGFGVAITSLISPETWSAQMLVVIFTMFFVDFFDTAGTLMGVANQAGLMKDNKLPRAGRALASDSLGSIAGAIIGTSSTTSYVESSAGVAAGGRTGFTAVVTACFFFLALFFSPLLSVVTSQVTAAALVIVGVMMSSSLAKIEWDQIDEAIAAFLTVVIMLFSYSIATGIAFGFLIYPILKLVKGEGKNVHPIMYILAVVFIIYLWFLR